MSIMARMPAATLSEGGGATEKEGGSCQGQKEVGKEEESKGQASARWNEGMGTRGARGRGAGNKNTAPATTHRTG
jgi:hypothetical protein